MKEKLKPQIKNIVDRLPLEKFIPSAFLIFLLLFIILTIIIYNNINSYRENISRVNHTHLVLKTIDDIGLSLTQIQLDRRGYIVKLDNKYLLEYYNNKNKVKEKFTELKALTSDNPSQSLLVTILDSLAAKSIFYLDSSIEHFEVNKKSIQDVQTSLVMESQSNLDQLFLTARDLKDEEIRELNYQQEKANKNLGDTQVFIIAASLFVFVVLGFSLFISSGLIKNKNNAERLLKKSYDELEDKVEERTAELKASNENLVSEINNRIKVEKSLRESEQRFKQLADSAPVLIWMSDKNKLCTYFNKVWLDFTGRTMEQELGNGWAEGVYPQDLNRCLDIYNAAFDKRQEFEMEYRLRTSAGDYRWILDRGIPRYEGNEFIGYIGSCLDIHSKKRTERYLHIQYTVSKSLAESKTVREALNRIIENICIELEWDMGLIWLVESNKLHQASIWGKDKEKVMQYSGMYDANYTFEKGIGLPGRVWKYNKSAWVQDIESDNNLPRQIGLKQIGMKSGLAFPVVGNDIIGVIECFNMAELTPKEDLLQILETVGRQIGSFIERKRVEEQLKESHDELESRVQERTIELGNTLNKLLAEMEQKEKIQNKLRESEENLRLLFENVKDYSIIRLDINGNIVSWNKGAEAIKGYTANEIIGKHFSIFYTAEEIGKNEPDYSLNMAKNLGRFENQGWRVRKDGSLFWADIIFTVLYDDEGKLIGFVKVTRDITDRKKASEAVIESEKKLKEAQKIAKLGSWEWDVKSNKVKWSDEMFSIYEISPEDFDPSYEGFLSRLHPDSLAEVKSKIENAYSSKSQFDFYERILIPGGGSKVLRSKGGIKTDENGNVTKLVGTCLDVTEVTEAEEVIKRSEKQLKDAQQIAKLGSWEVDMKTNLITWSEEMYRVFEIDMNEEPKSYEYIRNFIDSNDLEYVDKAMKQLETNPGEVEIGFRITTKEGRLKYIAADIRVEFNENSKPLRLYGSIQDITEIKLVEEELRKANAKLIEAQKELVHNEKLAALGRFSSGIAHEIRNPLANISALAQLLSKSNIEDEKMKKHLKYILINSDIANNIIKDLLHFASPEDLVFKTENLNTILENIINSVEPRCNENKILVSKRLSIDAPEMLLDKTRLENALLNFISNSIDAMPEGGNLSVNAQTDNISNTVIIDVIDTGEGIPQENLDKIFEPFFTTKETGTGLGLGLAYQTIKLHQGILNISSEPGKGTHVQIKIPVRKNINS